VLCALSSDKTLIPSFLPRGALQTAERGCAIVNRLSVCPYRKLVHVSCWWSYSF